jgi:hypothetical protein
MIAPGRNRPCPCGSGKRYKDCHGALGAPSGPLAGDSRWVAHVGRAAAQQAGLPPGDRDVRGVIAQHPNTSTPAHARGRPISAATSSAPGARYSRSRHHARGRGAGHNLQLIESALERRAIERAEVPPRLASAIAPAVPDDLERCGTTPT